MSILRKSATGFSSNERTGYLKRIVALSTSGGHVERDSGLRHCPIWEEELKTIGIPVAFIRAAGFIENLQWDIPAAKASGSLLNVTLHRNGLT